MNFENIVSNETAQQIAKVLASRERISHETNLDRLKTLLINSGYKIVSEELDQFFKNLEDAGFGAVIHGRGNKNTRFKWYYSLRDVGKAAMNPGTHVELNKFTDEEIAMKRKPRSPKAKTTRVGRPRLAQPTTTPGLKVVLTTESGKTIYLSISEAEKLIKDVSLLTSKLS